MYMYIYTINILSKLFLQPEQLEKPNTVILHETMIYLKPASVAIYSVPIWVSDVFSGYSFR